MIDSKNVRDVMNQMANVDVNINDTYICNGKRVPRVTEVLSAMLHDDSFMSWSNSLGWKRISYKAFMKDAADKGTYSHMAVEKYLKNGSVNLSEFNIVNKDILKVVESCLDGFKKWWEDLHRKYSKIEIVFVEETLIHPYFGGTCDCLLKVDDKYYLIDFKTSNHMSYNYGLQLSAYRFLFKELKDIDIGMCSIVMLDKKNHNYRTYDLYLDNDDHLRYINDCENTYITLAAAYKMRLYTTDEYNKVFKIK